MSTTDAAARTEAARELARARWGRQRLRTMVGELEQRRDELDAPLRHRLAVLGEVSASSGTETRTR